MNKKVKQVVRVEGKVVNVGSLALSQSTFNGIEKAMKIESRIKTLPRLKHIVQMGECRGRFSKGGAYGYLFNMNSENVIVDIDRNEILTAFKDKEDEDNSLHRSTVKIDEIEPLNLNIATRKVEPSKVTTRNTIKIGDTIFNTDTIELSDHFLKRLKERFFITDKECVRKFMKDVILTGEYLGITKDNDLGNEAHTFAKSGKAVFVGLDGKRMITTYEKCESRLYPSPKEMIKNVLQKRINNLKKEECKLNNKNKLTELEINIEIAKTELKCHRAKSESMKLSYQAYINGLKDTKQQLEMERVIKAKELNDYTKSMIAFT